MFNRAMTHISRFKLNERVLDKIFKLFFEVVGKNPSKKEFEIITNELLSYTERIMIAKRIAIMYLLLRGIERRNIARVLKVSSETISKFSLLLRFSNGIKPILNRMKGSDELSIVLEELFHALFGPGNYGVDWTAAWERRRSISRKKEDGI